MALGVDGMRASKVVVKVVCLTLLYQSVRAVMDVGGACASGGAYQIRQACPKGVGWVVPASIFGMFFAGIFTFVGVFPDGGARPYVFSWSALFLALGWNFLDDGFNPPGRNGTVVGWVICGVVFVVMGGVPLLFLLAPRAARWSLWGPNSQRADDYLHPYKPPPVRSPKPDAPALPPAPAARKHDDGDVVERLATLADLRERGMLDDDEYERAKRAVLDEETS